MSGCKHENFAASVDVGRLTGKDGVTITAFTAQVKINCTECGRRFQFLGMKPGIDLQGARISIDGMEAHLAICPRGEMPSPLDRIAVNFPTDRRH